MKSYQHDIRLIPPPRDDAAVPNKRSLGQRGLVLALLCAAAGMMMFLFSSSQQSPMVLEKNVGFLWGSSKKHAHSHGKKKKKHSHDKKNDAEEYDWHKYVDKYKNQNNDSNQDDDDSGNDDDDSGNDDDDQTSKKAKDFDWHKYVDKYKPPPKKDNHKDEPPEPEHDKEPISTEEPGDSASEDGSHSHHQHKANHKHVHKNIDILVDDKSDDKKHKKKKHKHDQTPGGKHVHKDIDILVDKSHEQDDRDGDKGPSPSASDEEEVTVHHHQHSHKKPPKPEHKQGPEHVETDDDDEYVSKDGEGVHHHQHSGHHKHVHKNIDVLVDPGDDDPDDKGHKKKKHKSSPQDNDGEGGDDDDDEATGEEVEDYDDDFVEDDGSRVHHHQHVIHHKHVHKNIDILVDTATDRQDEYSHFGPSGGKDEDKKHMAHPGLRLEGYPSLEVQEQYLNDLQKIDWDAVEEDLVDLMTDSQDWWPADYGNYGGLFVRLSWHSCGSYRTSDGRGGCDGGGQRFDPERSWPDNTNLDKARRLLQPIKTKYGNGLSWGDLFALSGTVAIKSMGGPVLGFCAGRLDFQEPVQTQALGPTPEQEKFATCEVNGQCPFPLGQNTLGLIYVNPEGPMGEPDLTGAAATVRDVFGRMDWHGRELVALIGGGHTFGKAHGATTASPGDPPNKCPFAPWNGATGMEAVTSGFEGPWTEEPTKWDNKYFQYLVEFEWEPIVGPGGHHQWRVKGGNGPKAPVADPKLVDQTQDVMMLTTDVALKADPEYFEYVKEFSQNITAFSEAFAKAWYQLVTRDVGPVERCVGPKVPPAQPFQHALPKPADKLADMDKVAHDVKKLIKKHEKVENQLIRLAFQCASTYRATDYLGGCNGARIRFPPGSEWPINEGLDKTLELLEPIKKKHGKGLSYADLIVLAGTTAAEHIGAPKMRFCPGRTDADDGSGWNHVEFGLTEIPSTVEATMELCKRRGQTYQECVALSFPVFRSSESLGGLLETRTTSFAMAEGLIFYPELRVWADYYVAAGTLEYARDFAEAWTRLMNADRFQGPLGNVCA